VTVQQIPVPFIHPFYEFDKRAHNKEQRNENRSHNSGAVMVSIMTASPAAGNNSYLLGSLPCVNTIIMNYGEGQGSTASNYGTGEEAYMSARDSVAKIPGGHVRTLGVCWIVYGIIRLIVAAWLVFVTGTATLMFGALLNRVPDPFTLMNAFHFIYATNVVLSALCGLLGILGGLALLVASQSGRTLALVAGFLALTNLPVGTTLGIYTLIVLLPSRAKEVDGHSGQTIY
jgi:hypothetical protein